MILLLKSAIILRNTDTCVSNHHVSIDLTVRLKKMETNMTKGMLFIILIINFSFLGGCAGTGGGLNSMSKTNQLMPGMSTNNVKNILGNPSQTQFII